LPPPDSTLLSGGSGRQLLHIIVAFFVLSYIAFDVLDLDLSAFPLQPTHKQVVIVAEVPTAAELSYLPDHDGFWTKRPIIAPAIARSSMGLTDNRVLRILWFHNARAQIYRINYPPSSTHDSDPSAA
jgi:hypothetical protein